MRKWKNEGTSLEWKMRLSERKVKLVIAMLSVSIFSEAKNERMKEWNRDGVGRMMGTQRKITRAVRTKYDELQDWNDMRTVRL